MLNCESLIMCDQQRFARKAKKEVTDYTEKPEKRKRKKPASQASEPLEDEEMNEPIDSEASEPEPHMSDEELDKS